MEPLLLTQEEIALLDGTAAALGYQRLHALADTIQRQYQRSLPLLVFHAALASFALLLLQITRHLANLDSSARTCSPLDPARLDSSKI